MSTVFDTLLKLLWVALAAIVGFFALSFVIRPVPDSHVDVDFSMSSVSIFENVLDSRNTILTMGISPMFMLQFAPGFDYTQFADSNYDFTFSLSPHISQYFTFYSSLVYRDFVNSDSNNIVFMPVPIHVMTGGSTYVIGVEVPLYVDIDISVISNVVNDFTVSFNLSEHYQDIYDTVFSFVGSNPFVISIVLEFDKSYVSGYRTDSTGLVFGAFTPTVFVPIDWEQRYIALYSTYLTLKREFEALLLLYSALLDSNSDLSQAFDQLLLDFDYVSGQFDDLVILYGQLLSDYGELYAQYLYLLDNSGGGPTPNVFSWLFSAFFVLETFLSVQIFPDISIGLILMMVVGLPLVVFMIKNLVGD